MHIIWGAGLVIAAAILGYKDTNALPWAIAALGAWVFVGAMLEGARLDKLHAPTTPTPRR